MDPTLSPVQQALDVIEQLPNEDQLLIVEVMRQRLIEQRRAEIATNAKITMDAVREGKARYGNLDDLRRELLHGKT